VSLSGIGASGVAFFAVGNANERPHRLLLLLLLLVAAATAGWAGRRLGNRRAASPGPAARPSD
jgi:hypothetical protein